MIYMVLMRKCRKCGYVPEPDEEECPKCGYSMSDAEMEDVTTCPDCGEIIMEFKCSNCGRKFKTSIKDDSDTN